MKKLIVKNLPHDALSDPIAEEFGTYGKVLSVVLTPGETPDVAEAVVLMENDEEAQDVIESFDQEELLGRVVRVISVASDE